MPLTHIMNAPIHSIMPLFVCPVRVEIYSNKTNLQYSTSQLKGCTVLTGFVNFKSIYTIICCYMPKEDKILCIWKHTICARRVFFLSLFSHATSMTNWVDIFTGLLFYACWEHEVSSAFRNKICIAKLERVKQGTTTLLLCIIWLHSCKARFILPANLVPIKRRSIPKTWKLK